MSLQEPPKKKSFQDSSTSAAQGNRVAQDVVKTLLKDRTDTSFSLFWARILQRKTTEIQTIEDPKLPGKRKAPVSNEVGEQDTHYFPETPKTITDESTLMRSRYCNAMHRDKI